MNTAVAVRTEGAVAALSRNELVRVLRNSLYPGAATESIELVLDYCEASGMDPMQKPVHIVPMWDGKAKRMRDVIMPGVGLYRTNAARSGAFAGMTEPEYGGYVTSKFADKDGRPFEVTFPEWCRVTAKRRLPTGEIAEFSAVEYWEENYATAGRDTDAPNAMWRKRPRGQLGKCAQAQALRLAFPEMASAMTAEEMEGKPLDPTGEIVEMVPSAPPELLAAGKTAAAAGTEAYRVWWGSTLTKEQRHLLQHEHDAYKVTAAAADEAKAQKTADADGLAPLATATADDAGGATFGDITT